MKVGRNEPCPCGSGKKYKRCCIDGLSKQYAEAVEEFAQIVTMNPDLGLDDLKLVAQQRMHARNHQPIDDFCGLSSTQMENWLYAELDKLMGVTISTPSDLSSSPVMRYLTLLLDEAMLHDGSFRATAKGNLPVKLVKQAAALLPEIAVAELGTMPSISEYTGSNEERFNALHYTRVLAEIAGIIYHKGGRFYIKKAVQKQYQEQGVQAFFLPMLNAAVTQYNWGYLDNWGGDIDLRLFWLFMLWRLQQHSSVDQLSKEVAVAFPSVLQQLPADEYSSPENLLKRLIQSRFLERFLQYWGFVIVGRSIFDDAEDSRKYVTIQPLFKESFGFSV